MKACQLSSVWKILEKEFSYSLSSLILHRIKLENFVMQLKRPSVEAWQNKSTIQKRIIPARTQSKTRNFQTSRPCEVRRSGQATTFVVCAVFSLSFQAVVLVTKTAITINYRFPFFSTYPIFFIGLNH